MLFKRIDECSIPYGLAIAGEDIVKGSAVVVKVVGGVTKAFYPSTQTEADNIKGFATNRIDTVLGSDSSHDVISAGSRLVIYTTPKDTSWGTTRFVGTPAKGDKLVVGYNADTDAGKLRALTTTATTGEVATGRVAKFFVEGTYSAGNGYTDAVIDVTVL